MGLFNRTKKMTLDEVMKNIDALSEEEQESLFQSLQARQATSNSVEDEANAADETTNENVETESNEKESESFQTEKAGKSEKLSTPTETDGEPNALAEESMPVEEPVAEEETEAVALEPQQDSSVGINYEELFNAQNAKFESLESVVQGLKETVEKIVANQDNKNFGYSPKANFDDEANLSRMDAVMQSYAPRRAEQYK